MAGDAGRVLLESGDATQRDEHASAVLRLRRALTIAIVAWPAFILVDLFVVAFVHPGRLWVYLTLRAIGLVPLFIGVVATTGERPPSAAALRWVEAGGCGMLSVLISLSSLESGGIVSPVVLGVMLILIARGAIITDSWQRALLPIALITLAYPVTQLVLAAAVEPIRAQLHDPHALAAFALNALFLSSAALMTLVGGHMVWSLRRKVFESRSLGRYRLKHRIGAGGMGEVWAAHHHALRRDVAVKILRTEASDDPAVRARFEREVRATAELVHPHTVRVFDYGVTEDGLWYYAMELLDGHDLRAIVSEQGPLEARRAARLMWQAAKALSEAHLRGIVHRDVKPENLFVTSVGGEGEFIKVLDFGLARLLAPEVSMTLTGEGWAVGTPRWASPEIAMGVQADARSDVYGLGAVLYYALCGVAPFDYPDLAKTLLAHMHETPVPPSRRLGRALPGRLEEVVLRCLAKDPAHRYATAAALAAALEWALGAPAAAPVRGIHAALPVAVDVEGRETGRDTERDAGGDTVAEVVLELDDVGFEVTTVRTRALPGVARRSA